MDENPYCAPHADLDGPTRAVAVPPAIARQIRQAWIAGLVSTAITLALTVAALAGKPLLGFSAWQLLDVGLLLGLSFGIYRRSRACAIGMLVYFIISKLMIFSAGFHASALLISLIFFYYYAMGIVGTVAWHRLMRQ